MHQPLIIIHHNLSNINFLIFVIPTLLIIINNILVKTYQGKSNFLSLCQFSHYFPQYRITMVFSSICDISILMVFYIKDKVIKLLFAKTLKEHLLSTTILYICSYIFLMIGIIGHILLSFFIFDSYEALDYISNSFFFLGFTIFSVLYNQLCTICSNKKSNWSTVFTFVYLFINIFSYLLYICSAKSTSNIQLFASIMQNIGYILTFFRLLLFHYVLPNHTIKMTQQ